MCVAVAWRTTLPRRTRIHARRAIARGHPASLGPPGRCPAVSTQARVRSVQAAITQPGIHAAAGLSGGPPCPPRNRSIAARLIRTSPDRGSAAVSVPAARPARVPAPAPPAKARCLTRSRVVTTCRLRSARRPSESSLWSLPVRLLFRTPTRGGHPKLARVGDRRGPFPPVAPLHFVA